MSCLAMRPKTACCSGNGYVHFPAELTHATVKTLVLSRNPLNLAAHQQAAAPVVNPMLRVEVSFVVTLLMLLPLQCCWDLNVSLVPCLALCDSRPRPVYMCSTSFWSSVTLAACHPTS